MRDEGNLVARLTAPGIAALATIGLRGPGALSIAASLFSRPLDHASPNRHLYGVFGRSITDDVVLRVKKLGAIQEIEIHCHGGPALSTSLIEQIVAAGAQLATWEDYFLAGGSTAIQIEAMAALARCRTARCASVLLDQYHGALDEAFAQVAGGNRQLAEEMLDWSTFGQHLVNSWRVALLGRANVGKSRLLNALLGFQRAIVADVPGTTRDVIHAETVIDGWPIELLDGAGFRENPEDLEAEGIKILVSALESVDLRILVLDSSQPTSSLDSRLFEQLRPDLVVATKGDLPRESAPGVIPDIVCSAETGEGVDAILAQISRRLVPRLPAAGQPVPFTARQVDWLRQYS